MPEMKPEDSLTDDIDPMGIAFSVARECSQKYGHDVSLSKAEAVKRIRKLPVFQELVDTLLNRAIGDMVEQCRHETNRAIKRAAGLYGVGAKVVPHENASVQKVYQSLYNLNIGGTMLGMVLGRDLEKIAETEESCAQGHNFNAALCRLLAPHVPKDKRVMEVITEKRLRSIFQRAKDSLLAV